jgi:large subunit ribosomal protein L10
MKRQQKAALVDSLRENITDSQAAFVVGFKGLTVNQIQALRTKLRSKGGSFKVAKARLMKRAIEGLGGADDLRPYLKNQIGLVFAKNNSPEVAKALDAFAKENEGLLIVVGLMDSRVLVAQDVRRIATLPSREVLLAQLCVTLQAPTTKLASTLSVLITKLPWTLQAVADKKQG